MLQVETLTEEQLTKYSKKPSESEFTEFCVTKGGETVFSGPLQAFQSFLAVSGFANVLELRLADYTVCQSINSKAYQHARRLYGILSWLTKRKWESQMTARFNVDFQSREVKELYQQALQRTLQQAEDARAFECHFFTSLQSSPMAINCVR